ncbi:MAG: SEC-C metal-binding domain-containing protein [Candidatus Cloacimonadales bacterium]|nr:SEC-C metal-binding domain-containing protein [Candidatus Cloacimonadales bacterium]
MTTKEFWNHYIKDNKLEIFDIACEFFSKELPEEFVQDYDVEEVIMEIYDSQTEAKNFDNAIKFAEIIENQQPKFYLECFQFIDKPLLDYYCFQHDKIKAEQAFSNFIKHPIRYFDYYLQTFKKLLYYQYTELLDKAILENFAEITESDELIGRAEHDLAECKYYMILEDFYKANTTSFDVKSFGQKIAKYDFEFKNYFYSSLATGLFGKPIENVNLIELYKKNRRENFLIILHGYFFRFMHEKNFPFYQSGKIWDGMLTFLTKNNNSRKITDGFFNIDAKLFEQHLLQISSIFFLENNSELIFILWGSVYIYEFLYKNQIISQPVFDEFLEISRKLKGKVIGQYTNELWASDFVHDWVKPDCISETEFQEETKIFRKSLFFKGESFLDFKDIFSEEMAKIGELSSYIVEGGLEEPQHKSLLDNFPNLSDYSFDDADDIQEIYPIQQESKMDEDLNVTFKPVRREKKIGRNDPCPCDSGKKYKKCCGKIS